jgi:signal transduction histidine kinase
MMAAIPTCVLVHDAASKRILWANPAACELLEWSLTELRPLKANDMSSSARQYDRVIGRALLQEAVEKGSCRFDWHYRTRSGRTIPTEAVAVRIELAQGPAVMVQFRNLDPTAMGDLATTIAHELGQPLAAASNFLSGAARHLETLTDGSSSPSAAAQIARGVENGSRQIERARSIVDALRSFALDLQHPAQLVDLNELLEECLYFVRLRAEQAGVEVVAHVHPTQVQVWCEWVLTGQVVLNLCANAIEEVGRLQPDRRLVEVTVSQDADRRNGLLIVDDEGQGPPPHPFSAPFSSKEHGSGVGLELSHRIITRQGGVIWAEERRPRGSRFVFSLPLADPVAEPVAEHST